MLYYDYDYDYDKHYHYLIIITVHQSIFRYPLEPPIVRFTTPVRHPNIDEVSGRICLDLLRMPPEGSWRPNVSIGSLLVSIQVLLACPNLDDPVRPDLISEWTKEDGGYKEDEEGEYKGDKDKATLTLTRTLTSTCTFNEKDNTTKFTSTQHHNDDKDKITTNKRPQITSLSLSSLRKRSKS